jgi:hypothetical protein
MQSSPSGPVGSEWFHRYRTRSDNLAKIDLTPIRFLNHATSMLGVLFIPPQSNKNKTRRFPASIQLRKSNVAFLGDERRLYSLRIVDRLVEKTICTFRPSQAMNGIHP